MKQQVLVKEKEISPRSKVLHVGELVARGWWLKVRQTTTGQTNTYDIPVQTTTQNTNDRVVFILFCFLHISLYAHAAHRRALTVGFEVSS